ncbi:hypothetical protein PUN28_008499 [Cardiocondyla obscurior]|uniref:Uncharacterized protein n=1 Tax=Cardiocondyla obscurior TaxID=286306 RepID=A0AAW2G409_9HYME
MYLSFSPVGCLIKITSQQSSSVSTIPSGSSKIKCTIDTASNVLLELCGLAAPGFHLLTRHELENAVGLVSCN